MTRLSWRLIVVPAVCCLAFAAGAFLVHAQTSLSSEWIRFPDGTIQSTAAGNCVNPADPDDEMIRVGGVCIDKYEASVWSSPTGGTQYGISSDDYPWSDNGQDCFGLMYARSVQGVTPSTRITWLQAQAALANSGKRLPTNAGWQMAALATPDTGGADDGATTCNTGVAVVSTGSRSACFSAWGHHDMVGNVAEWVADWDEQGAGCSVSASESLRFDVACVGRMDDDINNHFPGLFIRGGDWNDDEAAGVFYVNTMPGLSSGGNNSIGFRGAR